MLIKTSSTEIRFSRRALLAGLGVSAAMIPLLDAEQALGASANAMGFPKRLVTITWANGACQTSFYPSSDTAPVASTVLTPLAALASKVIVVAGPDLKHMTDNDHTYDGHYSFPVLFTGTYKNTGGQTCTAEGPSLDQVVSDAIAKKVALPVPLMNITLNGKSTSYRDGGQRNTGDSSPSHLFSTVFSGTTMSADKVAAAKARRQSVIDYVSQELTGFKARMGTDDQAKIEAHLGSIRALETQLGAASSAGCAAPMTNTTSKAYPDQVKAMLDIVAIALKCDITRVVSMVLADNGGSSPASFPHLGLNGDYHALAHLGASGYGDKSKIDAWYYTQVAAMASQLDSFQEGTGTVLDNSVIVTATDMAEGSFHSVSGMPFVLIGGCGGYFNTGRAVRVGSWAKKSGSYWSSASGVAHNLLLASLSNAMLADQTTPPVESFGSSYTGTFDSLLKK